MIFDNLKNAKQYYTLGEKIQRGFEFLINTDLNSLEDGKYTISGDEIYANVQSLETKAKEEKKWEVHRKYIDIQYIIKGKECMGYGLLENFSEIIEKYDENKDVEFLNGNKFNFINIEQGEFIIFYPNDVHAPMLAINEKQNIKKVIVKIAL